MNSFEELSIKKSLLNAISDLDFEKPLHNELVIDVDKETEDESFYKILTLLENK